MCGRYTLFSDPDLLRERFLIMNDFDYALRYNIAPSQRVLAVINDGRSNRAGYLRWGLIPSWAKDARIGFRLINARAETVDERPAFRNAFLRRRCLIPADSFFEWKREGNRKTPMRIRLKSGEPFAFAGLWDRWISPSGEEITSCTIITTRPNELMAELHDRMPVILRREHESVWLDRSVQNPELLKQFLIPYPSEEMEAYEVSPIVNSPNNDVPECIQPVKEQNER